MRPLVIPLPGNETLTERIAASGKHDLGALEVRRFPDGETYVRHRSNLNGRSVSLICTLNDPDPKLMTLILAAAAARALGAVRVGLVAPYLAYMRQDRAFHEGEAISAVHFARVLSREFDWLATIDPHLHRVARLEDIYGVPAAALHAGPLLADWIRAKIDNPVLIGPDAESEQWVSEAARIADAPYAVARKVRLGDKKVSVAIPDISRWGARTPVLVDDVASTGQTLIACVDVLRKRAMRPPVCVVVHPLFAGGAYAQLLAASDRVVSTNTIPHESNLIDVSGMLAHAVSSSSLACST